MTAPQQPRRDELAKVADYTLTDDRAVSIAVRTLPNLNTAQRWMFVDAVRKLARRIDEQTEAIGRIAQGATDLGCDLPTFCRPGESPAEAASREIGQLRGLLDVAVAQALEADEDARRFREWDAAHPSPVLVPQRVGG